MSDERFDRDLGDVLREIAGDEAPMSLRFRLSDITERAPIGRRLWFATPMRLSVVAAAAMAVLALAIIFLPRETVGPTPSDSPSIEPTPTVEPTATPAVEPSPAPTGEPTVAPTSAPVPTATPTVEWSGLVWSDPVTPSFVVHLADLVPWGEEYVAVGTVGVDASGGGAFLTSPDGLNWTIVEQDGAGVPSHLVALGDELLAFSHGVFITPPGSIVGAPPSTFISRSTDGGTWEQIDSQSWDEAWFDTWDRPEAMLAWDETQYGITIGLVDVASGPDGLVAIGNSFGDDAMAPIILHSTDGQSWTAVALPAGSDSALLNTVVSHGDGFVMVGAVDVGPDPVTAVPASWHSTDGLTWTRAMVEADPSRAGVLHGEFGPLMAGRDGLVTCFGSRSMGAGGWRFMDSFVSADSATWEDVLTDLEHPIRACGWAAGDGVGIVALGGLPAPTGQPWPGVTSAWVSSDGATWEPLTLSVTLTDMLERFWVVPDGVIYAGEQSFWFGTAVGR